MNYFTCDACHYIFQSDSASAACPSCNASSIIAHNSIGKKFKVPAIRLSTEMEAEQSRAAETAEATKRTYLERVEGLSGYTLTNDEYHAALILLFYFKSSPEAFASIHLESLLNQRHSGDESRKAGTPAMDLYSRAKKHFTSELGKERRETGCNDAIDVAAYTDKGSAAGLLIRFRQGELDQLLGKTPNLADIRSVDLSQVAEKPGEDYLRFLMDWYHSVRN